MSILPTILYLWSFFANLSCAGISLFLMLSHEDVDVGALEPLDLSDSLTWLLKIELLVNIWAFPFSLLFMNWYIVFAMTPIFLFNLRMLMKKTYVHKFMFMSEYKTREDVEATITVKMVIYLFYVVLSFFMFIYKLAEYVSHWY